MQCWRKTSVRWLRWAFLFFRLIDPSIPSATHFIDIENPAKLDRDCVKREKGKRLLALTEE
jgi:hypothetical protein